MTFWTYPQVVICRRASRWIRDVGHGQAASCRAGMSLIHTAELVGANPFEYLVAVMRNAQAAAAEPDRWMPWNYAPADAAASTD